MHTFMINLAINDYSKRRRASIYVITLLPYTDAPSMWRRKFATSGRTLLNKSSSIMEKALESFERKMEPHKS